MLVVRRRIVAALLLFFISHIAWSYELTVVGEHSPPYLFTHNEKVTGIDAEIIKYVFGKLGVQYKLEIRPFARNLKMLEDGQADIVIALSKTDSLAAIAHFPQAFTRNAEYSLITNTQTKKKHNATSLTYAKENNFKLGVVRGKRYSDRLWQVFPRANGSHAEYHSQIVPTRDIDQALKMLSLNRINAFVGEPYSALYSVHQLGIKGIEPYDFVAFFKPKFNVFAKQSHFSSEQYPSIAKLLVAYDQVLTEFKQQPEFQRIFNWDWQAQPLYEFKPRQAITTKQGETVNIGFLAALTGSEAGWGKPGLTGNQLFIDEVNAVGGLLVNGVRHPLNMFVYDDKSNPELALKGAQELVEKYNVRFISGIGGVSADATHPYLTEKKVIYASLISTDIKPDRPYLLAGGDVTPRIDMLRPWYHKNKNPSLKRWAVISQDDPIARSSQVWEVGAAVAEGWEVVFDRHFPLQTTDFSALISTLLAQKPDVVSLNLTWPDFVPLIMEQLYTQGYRGEISGNYMDEESNLKKVPQWFHEGAVDSFPLFNDPFWEEPSIQHDFYKKWSAKYGKGAPEDVKRGITGIDWDHVIMLRVWAFGAQLAGSFEPDKIIAALRRQKAFPTLLGQATMKGSEMWGIQNMVSPPIPINETREGVKRIQTVKRFDEWFQANKKVIIDVVKNKGYYWQTQGAP